MFDARKMPALFFAPFVSSPMRVEPHWVDTRGHVSIAYYHVLFDRALDEALGLVGLGYDYVLDRGHSFYTTEVHVVCQREISVEDPLRVRVQLVSFDDRTLHIFLELCHATEGWCAATCELISHHLDMSTRKIVPFPQDIAENLAEMRSSHGWLPRPETVGRGIQMPQRLYKQ